MFQEKCINDQTEIATTFSDTFLNISPNLTKNIIQKISHIFCRKHIKASILSSFTIQLIYYESLKKIKFALH